jgi:hypothetical protein
VKTEGTPIYDVQVEKVAMALSDVLWRKAFKSICTTRAPSLAHPSHQRISWDTSDNGANLRGK